MALQSIRKHLYQIKEWRYKLLFWVLFKCILCGLFVSCVKTADKIQQTTKPLTQRFNLRATDWPVGGLSPCAATVGPLNPICPRGAISWLTLHPEKLGYMKKRISLCCVVYVKKQRKVVKSKCSHGVHKGKSKQGSRAHWMDWWRKDENN